MENNQSPTCAVCGATLKFIPAGVSKTTGKPYSQFWSCPNRCPKNPQTAVNKSQFGPVMAQKNEYIKDAQERRDESIKEAQARKEEAVRIEGAKSAAGRIVAAMIEAKAIDPKDWTIKYDEVSQFVYNYKPVPFN